MLLLSLRHRLATTSQGLSSSEDGEGSSERGTIRLVLASQSPRRREILSMMGLEGRFEVVPSPVDESAVQRELLQQQGGPVAPPAYAEHLARAKALALAEHLKANPSQVPRTGAVAATVVVVLGSDTIVELDGRILEKPRDESEAKEMLSRLSGREHLVHTGVALACVTVGTGTSDEVSTRSFVDTAAVQFINLMPEDIDAYVSTGEPMDKAGSYGIQGIGGQMVESITGDFFTVRFCVMFEPVCVLSATPDEPKDSPTCLFCIHCRQVMGLPMCRVSQELARLIEELQP
jgi:septum formation protein